MQTSDAVPVVRGPEGAHRIGLADADLHAERTQMGGDALADGPVADHDRRLVTKVDAGVVQRVRDREHARLPGAVSVVEGGLGQGVVHRDHGDLEHALLLHEPQRCETARGLLGRTSQLRRERLLMREADQVRAVVEQQVEAAAQERHGGGAFGGSRERGIAVDRDPAGTQHLGDLDVDLIGVGVDGDRGSRIPQQQGELGGLRLEHHRDADAHSAHSAVLAQTPRTVGRDGHMASGRIDAILGPLAGRQRLTVEQDLGRPSRREHDPRVAEIRTERRKQGAESLGHAIRPDDREVPARHEQVGLTGEAAHQPLGGHGLVGHQSRVEPAGVAECQGEADPHPECVRAFRGLWIRPRPSPFMGA